MYAAAEASKNAGLGAAKLSASGSGPMKKLWPERAVDYGSVLSQVGSNRRRSPEDALRALLSQVLTIRPADS